ncbi:autotransporter domain-containing protein [Simkania sp.]|uniref:autotransporter family protein n=1 Tax=Simkania sp. TaxID=34094 RepID=UPI003B516C95
MNNSPSGLVVNDLNFSQCSAKGGDTNNSQFAGSGGGALGAGGGIFVREGQSLTLSNCHFDSCRAVGGTSGLAIDTGLANPPGTGGGGLNFDGGPTPPIFNSSGPGGGGVLTAGSRPTGGAGLDATGTVITVGGDGGAAGSGVGFPGGDGDYGGGGGGGDQAGNAPEGGAGGAGGFGGGGAGNHSAIGGNGGYAGGKGGDTPSTFAAGRGGGGGALGGAIFIDQDATLTIEKSVSFTGSSLIPGVGDAPGEGFGRDIFIRTTGNLVISNLTTNSSVPNPIESNIGVGGGDVTNGGLHLSGGNTARFTLNGDNTYTGTTQIDSGALYVDGSVITPVIIDGGGFGGTNTVVKINPSMALSGNLTVSSGILHPGGDDLYGLLTVERNLTIDAGSNIIDVEVDSVGNTDFIQVDGTTTINGGALQIEAIVGSFIEGQVIPILDSTGGVTGTFSNLDQPLRPNGTNLFEVQYLPNRIQLLVLNNSVFQEKDQTGLTGNPEKVCDYLLSFLPVEPDSDLGFVIRSIGLLTGKQLRDALNLLHPGIFGGLEWINLTNNSEITNIFRQRALSRSRSSSDTSLTSYLTASTDDRPFYPNVPIRRGCARDLKTPHSVWVQPFGSWNSQSRKGQLRGFNYDTAGLMAGYDYTFSHFDVGGGIGYTYTNVRWRGSAGKGHINQIYGGVYGSYFMDYFSVDLSTTLGGNFYNIHRNIFYNPVGHPNAQLDRVAKSSFNGLQWTNHLGLIGDFSPLSIPIQIFANFDHFYLNVESFKETGAKSLNLVVNTKVSNAIRSQLGLSSSYTFQMKNSCWTPYLSISWVNKTILSSSEYEGAFRGQTGTVSVNTTSKGANQIAPGLGLEVANKHGLSFLLNTRGELSGKMKNYFLDARFTYTF